MPWRRCARAAVHRDSASARLPLHRPVTQMAPADSAARPASIRRPMRRRGALRAQRRREHRVPGARQRTDRSGVRDGWVSHLDRLLARAVFRAVPAAARRVLAADSVRQAWNRIVRSGASRMPTLEQRMDDVRAVHGCGRVATGGAARVSRRAARCAACSRRPIPSGPRR